MPPRPFSKTHNGTAPGATCMSKQQMGDYLNDLRSNRVARPNGSRPLPPPTKSGAVVVQTEHGVAPKLAFNANGTESDSVRTSSRRISHNIRARNVSMEVVGQPVGYEACGEPDERLAEKQEAHNLRLVLQKLSIDDEDSVTESARMEAAELIRRHQFPNEPYQPNNRVLENKKRMSLPAEARYGALADAKAPAMLSSSRDSSASSYSSTKEIQYETTRPHPPTQPKSRRISSGLFHRHSLLDLAHRRRVSNTSSKTNSEDHQCVFRNPEDKIYVDPEERAEHKPVQKTEETVPAHVRRNPFVRARASRHGVMNDSKTSERTRVGERRHIQAVETFDPKNASKDTKTSTSSESPNLPEPTEVEVSAILYKDGIEVRSDEIRAATSMKLKDRSPRLPSPVVVTDSPGRPIVSFKSDWKPREKESASSSVLSSTGAEAYTARSSRKNTVKISADESPSITPQQHLHKQTTIVPRITTQNQARNSTQATNQIPNIPTINLPEIPSIAISGIPSIAITDDSNDNPTSSPARSSNISEADTRPRSRPLTASSTVSAINPNSHWTLSSRRPSALCAHCALPISGRIVTAAQSRFHPECFTCHLCHTNLECVAFFPEPAAHYVERVSRIQRRLAGEEVTETSADADGDDSLRFYCHLDFHESFSPRCKSCKTPIEGEVVIACGAEWHVGHFFCAQCGDPFEPATPFVEKDGYAWCVRCHTNRFSAKCRRCRKPVTDMVVNALDAEWHEECFVCAECGGGFADGRFFVRESQHVVCVGCEERRLKA